MEAGLKYVPFLLRYKNGDNFSFDFFSIAIMFNTGQEFII